LGLVLAAEPDDAALRLVPELAAAAVAPAVGWTCFSSQVC